LDRLFLRALVDELRPQVVGRRIRTALVDRGSGLLCLALAPPRPATFAVSFLRDAPGACLLPLSRPPGEGVVTPGLKKLVSSRVASIEMADLDRIVTISVEGKRLSGKTTAFRLVLEALGVRADLYLVDVESSGVVEAFSSTRARLGAGERYQAPTPPPGAASLAASASEVEERLARLTEGLQLKRRSTLLAATGATPLLVREMEWLVERYGVTAGDAFMRVHSRLEERRPFLYVPKSPSSGRHTLASPLELASESDLAPRAHASFSEAMAQAVSLETETRKFSALRARLESAVKKRLDRARRLEAKLRDDESSLEEPPSLRRRGELLLAGLSRARRTGDGRSVFLPDIFDSEEMETEIEVDPRLSLPKNAERFFTRARKAERARVELAKRLEAVGKDVSFWEGFECDLRDASTAVELEALEREAGDEGLSLPPSRKPAKTRPPEALGPRSFRSHRGSAILVGRSGRSNDELTFDVAKPRDLWFHASGVPGAHVVVRLASGETADEREIQEAAELAAYYSKRREDTAVDVIVTERRNVSRIKGAPRGLVKLSSAGETRTLRVVPRRPESDPGNR
jgi:predicted ribosome quality control (RQC) complex YloA/Tae2 family protein